MVGGLTLSDILRQRAARASSPSEDLPSVIFIVLGGGASQFETYDPKPDAPAEYRGPFQAIKSNVPGVQVCETLPQQAKRMNRMAIVRSIHHREASHIAMHMVETGYFLRNSGNARKGEMPAVGPIVSRCLEHRVKDIPAAVTLPRPFAYIDAHYLGAAYNFFAVRADPVKPEFQVKNLVLNSRLDVSKLEDRRKLKQAFDQERRVFDLHNEQAAMDRFSQQAYDLITGERARRAFDIAQEPSRLRDRYGRTSFGQRLILARRLAEAGVPFIRVALAGWDHHEQMEKKTKEYVPQYDTGVAALIDDIHQRGLSKKILIVAMGEFGRTPRINGKAGRDHWPSLMSVMLSGGAYKMGQVIGASDSTGSKVKERPYKPQSVLAMMYRHLGIDPERTFLDYSGRPRYILEEREPIEELM